MRVDLGIWIVLTFLVLSAASAQSGGIYQLEKIVVVSGGAESSGGNYSIALTTGQSLAGGFLQSGPFLTYHGFWNPDLGPTAASVSVSGRAITSDNRGIGNVHVFLTSMTGEAQLSLTNPNGYFRFDAVQAGQSYLLTAFSRQYEFEPRFISIADPVTDLKILPID